MIRNIDHTTDKQGRVTYRLCSLEWIWTFITRSSAWTSRSTSTAYFGRRAELYSVWNSKIRSFFAVKFPLELPRAQFQWMSNSKNYSIFWSSRECLTFAGTPKTEVPSQYYFHRNAKWCSSTRSFTSAELLRANVNMELNSTGTSKNGVSLQFYWDCPFDDRSSISSSTAKILQVMNVSMQLNCAWTTKSGCHLSYDCPRTAYRGDVDGL